MNKYIGIIVDGIGDFSSLRKRFRNRFKILKTDGPRGHTAQPQIIAKKSRKQVNILAAFRCSRIILLLDFEERTLPYKDFVRKLRQSFKCENFPVPLSVIVPNRMIENWYLADIEFLSANKAFLKNGIKQKNFEGKHGKNEIKRLMRKGESYSETKHGPQMFEIIRFDVARQNSASLDEFLHEL
jgi:hypothetical protein